MCNFADKQTNRQTDTSENITSIFGEEDWPSCD